MNFTPRTTTMCPSDRPRHKCADRVREPRILLKRFAQSAQSAQEGVFPPRTPFSLRKGRSTDAPPSACATGSGSAQTPQDMPGRLRRREAELYASIRDAESAGLDYWQSIRPLLVEPRDILAKRNAPEARRGAITPGALSVSAETLKTPDGPVIGHNGQNVKGNHNDT